MIEDYDPKNVHADVIRSVNWKRTVIAVISLIILMSISAYIGSLFSVKNDTSTHTVSSITKSSTNLSGWRTYSDSANKVKFQYPPNWNMAVNNMMLTNTYASRIGFKPGIDPANGSNTIYYSLFKDSSENILLDSFKIQNPHYKDEGIKYINGDKFHIVDLSDSSENSIVYIFTTKTGKLADISVSFTDPTYLKNNLPNEVGQTISY